MQSISYLDLEPDFRVPFHRLHNPQRDMDVIIDNKQSTHNTNEFLLRVAGTETTFASLFGYSKDDSEEHHRQLTERVLELEGQLDSVLLHMVQATEWSDW